MTLHIIISLYNDNSKIDMNNFYMYNYVDLYNEIYL